MNIQGLEFCSVIVIREGVVYSNELIVGTDHDAVAKQAEKRFVELVKEYSPYEVEAEEDIEALLEQGYWESQDSDMSVCISWADVLTNNILD
jgi:hypothetical protein